jgi:hypothetical protein
MQPLLRPGKKPWRGLLQTELRIDLSEITIKAAWQSAASAAN